MRAPTFGGLISLGLALLCGPAESQPRRPTGDGGLDIRAVPPLVESALARARTALDRGESSEAVVALDGLGAPHRRLDPVAALRAVAAWELLRVPVEPGGARAVAPSARRELVTLTATLQRVVPAPLDAARVAQALGRALLSQDDLDGADAALARFTQLRPRDPVGWNDLAMARVAQRRLPEAATCLETAVELAPEDADPWANLGAVYLARGDTARALTAFQRAATLAPTQARHHADLGAAALAAGDVTRAVASYERAVALRPTEGPLLANLGYALHLARRSDEALATLQRATTLSPRTVTAWNNLAAVLAARGDRAAARVALDRALALSPDDPRLRAQREALSSAEASPPPTAQRSPTTLPR